MRDYNLTDIHFHTDDSFDAYQNAGKPQFSIELVASSTEANTGKNVRVVCKTDHNVLNYSYYLTLEQQFEAKGIKLLPGIEINTSGKIHWLMIFDDIELKDLDDQCKPRGELLDELFNSIYGYSTLTGTIEERRSIQGTEIDIGEVIKGVNSLGLSYLAIPHFNKSHGGWYQHVKDDKSKLDIINYLISDNVIVGFESKNQEQDLVHQIKKTDEYLSGVIEKFNNGEISDVSEVTRRENHLSFLNDLKEMFEKNDTALIYGTDFHGEGNYDINKIFFMKSSPSYEGLKFALLDPYSRIFSTRRKLKHDKSSNYVIDMINLKDGTKITLGDGLNSIIGPRGSGKSYLLKCIIGDTSKYRGSDISKQIELDEIILKGNYSFRKLERHHFDIITQKNSVIGENTFNIYNLLSEAPYNYEKFSEGLSSHFAQEKTEKKVISEYLNDVNKQVDNYVKLYKLKEMEPDFSNVIDYNRYYSDSNPENLLNSKFLELFSLLERIIEEKTSKLEFTTTVSKNIEDSNEDIVTISKYGEVQRANLLERVAKFSKELENYKETIHNPLYELIDKDLQRTKKVLDVVKRINNRIRDNASNVELILNDSMTNIVKHIDDSITSLRRTRDTANRIQQYEQILVDKTEYSFSQEEFSYIIKLETKFDKSNVIDSQIHKMFEKYKSLYLVDSSYLVDTFEKQDFGAKFNALYNSKDNRFKDAELAEPELEQKIYLNINNEGFVLWDSLSPGQRSDILLNIILDTSSKKVLIIDQPEDDLDNEMIYKTIVRKLRKLKHKKQIIVVSHNANVVISGDSDTIVFCQNYDNNFKMYSDCMESKNSYRYTSMNTTGYEDTILNIASLILDGGKEALRRRVKKFGYRNLFFEED